MADALLRNVDKDLLADYRAEARANGRSLQAELQEGLKRGRPRRRLSKDELLSLSKELTGQGPMTSDSTPYIRRARDTDGGRNLGKSRQSDDRF
ncbi:MAG: antitoxin FitA [Sphingomonadales bacterium]|nr:antitoxin FitA [Sphingomonadales bacterium]